MGGLGVIRNAAGGDPETGNRKARYQRNSHDLQVGRTVGRVN
jgi:hypothetical protein